MQTLGARTDLITMHQDYMHALAREIHRRLPSFVEFDDLAGFGQVGLVEAAAHFDETRGVNFKTFAYPRIRGAILDGLAKMAGVPKGAPQNGRRLRSQWTAERGANDVAQGLADPAAAETHGASLARHFRDAVGRIGMVYALSQIGEDGAVDTSDDADASEDAATREMTARVRAAVGRLPADLATIVRMFYFEGCTLTDCARALGKHKAWISRLHVRALDALREAVRDPAEAPPPGRR